ncbi:NAD(P)-binding domain-containing protein, partial [Thermodesulfobacteriota bacterium]
MKLGFIGLGTMGAGIAMNALKGGHELVVHDTNKAAAMPHIDAGASWVDSPMTCRCSNRNYLHVAPRSPRGRDRGAWQRRPDRGTAG